MGCGSSLPAAAQTHITISVSDDSWCNFPTSAWIPGNKRNVPVPLRACFTFAEWLDIVAQLERTMLSRSGPCRGADPLRAPGESLAAALNATFAESRGVAFSLATFAYHPDRPGQQFDRKFHIDVVGECCILTHEHTIDVPIPAGAKPGKPFNAEILDGQVVSVPCPKDAAAGSTTSITMAAPVLQEQTLNLTVPQGAVGGQTIPVNLPGGGATAVQLPADAAPGSAMQIQVRCVQLRAMKEEQIEAVVPPTVKYNRRFRVALPGGGTKLVTAPEGVKAGETIKVTVKVPVD